MSFGAPRVRLARVGTDGNGYREIAGPFVIGFGGGLVWDRDGRTILMAPPAPTSAPATLPAAGPIQRIDAETGIPRPIGLEIGGLQNFDVSPDGSRIVFSKASERVTEVRVLENVAAVLKAVR